MSARKFGMNPEDKAPNMHHELKQIGATWSEFGVVRADKDLLKEVEVTLKIWF